MISACLKFLCCLLFIYPLFCQAEEPLFYSEQDYQLQQEMNYIAQMWVLSKDYINGTTVEQDKIAGYAWLSLYVESLPENYPGLETLLGELKLNLNQDETIKGDQLAQQYRDKYSLHFRLSEIDLDRILELKAYPPQLPATFEGKTLPDFPELLIALTQAKKTKLTEQLAQVWNKNEKIIQGKPHARLVYGQLNVSGPEDPQRVLSPFVILPEGYFIGVWERKYGLINFWLSGYQTVKLKAIQGKDKIVNLGVIGLAPLSKESQASIVGNLASNIEQNIDQNLVNIILKIMPDSLDPEITRYRDPWWWPIIQVSHESNGEFYANGLTPSRYRIIISYQGEKVTSGVFSLKPGEIKKLGTFELALNPQNLS